MNLPESITSLFIPFNKNETIILLGDIDDPEKIIDLISKIIFEDFSVDLYVYFQIVIPGELSDESVNIIRSRLPPYMYNIRCNIAIMESLMERGLMPFNFNCDGKTFIPMFHNSDITFDGSSVFYMGSLIIEYKPVNTRIYKTILPILPELTEYISESNNFNLSKFKYNQLLILIAKRLGIIGNRTKSAKNIPS
jgi:hypothetical protein